MTQEPRWKEEPRLKDSGTDPDEGATLVEGGTSVAGVTLVGEVADSGAVGVILLLADASIRSDIVFKEISVALCLAGSTAGSLEISAADGFAVLAESSGVEDSESESPYSCSESPSALTSSSSSSSSE